MPVIVQKLPVMSHAERAGKMRGQREGWRYLGETTAMMGTNETQSGCVDCRQNENEVAPRTPSPGIFRLTITPEFMSV